MHHAHAHGIIADQTAVLWVGVLTEKCVDLWVTELDKRNLTPVTGGCSKLFESSSHLHDLFLQHPRNTIIPPMFEYLLGTYSNQSFVSTFHFCRLCWVSSLSHPLHLVSLKILETVKQLKGNTQADENWKCN
jgi:hypothetical protein